MDSPLDSDLDENQNTKKYLVRLMFQDKSLFVQFREDELEIMKFAEKGQCNAFYIS